MKNKHKNQIIIVLFVAFVFGLNSAMAMVGFPKPINFIEMSTSNTTNEAIATEGQSIDLRLGIESDFRIQQIKIAGEEISYKYSCAPAGCIYLGSYPVGSSSANGDVTLDISYVTKKLVNGNTLSFPSTPVAIERNKNRIHSIKNINLSKSNKAKRPIATKGDDVSLSFYSKGLNSANFNGLSLHGIDFNFADLSALNTANGTKYTASFTVDNGTALGEVVFNLSQKLKDGKTINLTRTSDASSVKVVNFSDVNKPFVGPDIYSSNAVNSKQALEFDTVYFTLETGKDYEIEKLMLDGLDYKSQLTTTCVANGCEHKLSAKVIAGAKAKDLDLDLVYFENGIKRELTGPSDKLRILRDSFISNLIEKITFGENTEIRNKIKDAGFEVFLEEQLNPQAIDDSDFENNLKRYERTNSSTGASKYIVSHALFSKRQLQERMAYFWENHFNTSFDKWRTGNWRGYVGDSTQIKVNNLQSVLDIDTKDTSVIAESRSYADLNIDLSKYDQIKIINYFTFHNTSENDTEEAAGTPQVSKFYWTSSSSTAYSDDKSIDLQQDESDENKSIETILTLSPEQKAKFTGTLQKLAVKPSSAYTLDRYRIYKITLVDSTGVNPDVTLLTTDLISELTDNDFYRKNALGNFKDLALYTSRSPKMLYYLDNYKSTKKAPNENYGREYLELYVMGVEDDGTHAYNEDDVKAASRIFTGLTFNVGSGETYFDASDHDGRSESFSFTSETIPAGGYEQILKLHDITVAHPSTARFICKKLFKYLIRDLPFPTNEEVADCEDTFLANLDAPDQMAKVVRAIIYSQDFSEYTNYKAKVANPLVFMAGIIRKTDAFDFRRSGSLSNLSGFTNYLNACNYNLMKMPEPTGYKEESSTWFNYTQYQERIKHIGDIFQTDSRNRESEYLDKRPYAFKLTDVVKNNLSVINTKTVVEFAADLFLRDSFSSVELAQFEAIIGADFDIDAEDAETKLRKLFNVLAISPRAQLH